MPILKSSKRLVFMVFPVVMIVGVWRKAKEIAKELREQRSQRTGDARLAENFTAS